MNDEIKVELDKHIGFISSLTGVLQIYLFGSHANGESRETSDIDLMIVVENQLDPFKTAYEIRRGLIESNLILDIVVNRVSAFEEATTYASFQKTIKEKGILLYAA
ncbi:MAG: nucleotidyltransferase domain-containing protein [Clostridiales bacterium]|nr:nucleotidyltransferase domain-containing protein [Clostridiales bacterium]